MIDLDSIDLERLKQGLDKELGGSAPQRRKSEVSSDLPGVKELQAQLSRLKLENSQLRSEIARLLEGQAGICLERRRQGGDEEERFVSRLEKREWLRILGAAVLMAPLLSSAGGAAVRKLLRLGMAVWGGLSAGSLDPWLCLAAGLFLFWLSGRTGRK